MHDAWPSGALSLQMWARNGLGALFQNTVPLNNNSTSTTFISAENQCMITQEVHLCVPEPKCAQACGGLGCKRS